MYNVQILNKLVFHFAVTFIDTYACVDYKSVYPSRASNVVNSFCNMYVRVCGFYIEYFSRTLNSSDVVLAPQLDKLCVCCEKNSTVRNCFPVNILVTFVACMW